MTADFIISRLPSDDTMTAQYIISAILLGLICLIASTVIIYWHTTTRGSWRSWPAGQSLMGLLIIIAVGFGVGALNRFLGEYLAKDYILIGLYASFAGALVVIGLTVRKEMREGKARLLTKQKATAGPVTITVATLNEEKAEDDE